MFDPGWDPNRIAGTDGLGRFASFTDQPGPLGDMQCLPERMGVPRCARARFEMDCERMKARRFRGRNDWVLPYCSGEIVWVGPLCGAAACWVNLHYGIQCFM